MRHNYKMSATNMHYGQYGGTISAIALNNVEIT